jgi:NCK-associated protein 1
MSKLGERLVLLNDINEGLLCRTHYLSRFEKPPTINEEIDKVCQRIAKKFPDKDFDGLDKIPGYNIFKDRSIEISASLSDFYYHIVNINKFRQQASAVLTEATNRILEFQFDTHQDLMIRFFDLFVGYVQLMLVSSTLPDVSSYVTYYAYAYELTKSQEEPNWNDVRKFVDGMDKPVKRIREELEPLGLHIGQSLRNITEVFMSFTNINYLKDKNLFNLLESPQSLGLCEEDSFYKNIIFVNKMKLWILYGYLICPNELQGDPARELLKYALGDGQLILIYRDQSLSIHEQYDLLFSKFQSKKFKLSKHKDILKAAASAASAEAPADHYLKRSILRAELRNFLNLVRDFPGILGPKVDVLWAAVSWLKEETLWYFMHLDSEAASKSKSKGKDYSRDDNISELIYLLDQLVGIARKHKDFIRDFSYEYIKSKLPELNRLISEMLDSSTASVELKGMVEGLLSDLQGSTSQTDFGEIRATWNVLSALLADNQNGMTSRVAKAYMQLMTKIIYHTRNIDDLDGQISRHASLHLLWFYLDEYCGLFDQCLNASGNQPRHIISLVRTLDFAKNNCHRFCPEEQELISEKSVTLAEQLLDSMAHHVEELTRSIYTKEIHLLKSVIPQEAAQRFEAQQRGENVEPPPGFESYYERSQSVENLKQWKKQIADLCCGIKESSSVKVYNFRFSPHEFLYDSLREYFRKCYRKILKSEKRGFERPSIIWAKLNCLITSYECVASHLNLEIDAFIKHILIGETYDAEVQGVGNFVAYRADGTEEKREQELVVYELTDFYMSMLDNPLDQLGILFSDISDGFINYKPEERLPPNPSEVQQHILHYFHTPELKYLCQLLGPYGVRIFERRLLTSISAQVRSLKDILDSNKTTLAQIAPRLTQTSVWYEGWRKLNRLDELLFQSMKIAIALKFRKLLFKAYSEVISERAPFLYESVKELKDRLNPLTQNPELRAFWSITKDCGIDDITSDVNLLNVLRQFKGGRVDEELWKLLPELFGFLFMCKEWKGSNWLVVLNAHSNNGHCLAETIKTLIVGFGSIIAEAETFAPPPVIEIQKQIREQLKKFVRYSSYTILNMYHQNVTQPELWAGYDLPSMQMFLQEVRS